jgi:hypothetical protein
MGRIDLKPYPNSSLFSALVAFVYQRKHAEKNSIVDTGSECSSITEDTANSLGISLSGSSKSPVMGVNAIKNAPTVDELEVLILNDAKFVKLKNVQILEPIQSIHFKKVLGRKVPDSVARAALPDILGLDFLQNLKAVLVISYPSNEFYIKW